jgi:glycosyltransferase involved in cell wall biosynthesis
MMLENQPGVEHQSNIFRLPITVVVATKNEEANIASCLLSLDQAQRILVIDSGSTDRTQAIAKQYGAEVIDYAYSGGYPKKRQWALDHLDIPTPWIMLVDADEQVTAALWNEIRSVLNAPSPSAAYLVLKQFHFLGKRFRFGGFSHSAIMLFRTGHARFEETAGNSLNGQDMEVHERLIVEGKVGRLRTPLLHDDCKGLFAYCDRHNKYSSWEAGIRAHYLMTGSWGQRTIKASIVGDAQSFRRLVKPLILRLPFEPLLWFLYHYVIRGAVFEGRRGYIASSLRRAYIEQVHAKLYELKAKERYTVAVPSEPDAR